MEAERGSGRDAGSESGIGGSKGDEEDRWEEAGRSVGEDVIVFFAMFDCVIVAI